MVQVVDMQRSEIGPQRRREEDGRVTHCCCICGNCGPWSGAWSWWGSEGELDNGKPVAKFCSQTCRLAGGDDGVKVTIAMKQKARDAEWRDPKTVYRPATDSEKFNAALQSQRQK